VQERKQKLTNGTKALVHQLIEDSSTGKAVSFHTLKALAAKGIGNFTKITKKEAHFICHLFGIEFQKSYNKEKLELLLINGINVAKEMTYPNRCTQEELDMVTVNKKCKVCVTDRNVQTGSNTCIVFSSYKYVSVTNKRNL
jgi:transposase-like protein